ncbi:MAG: tetratricopeptide repeat protein, partial [Nitrospinota bacterium]|nr:tetratricopeptide repeat protein [Nitrospinota bacterium]
NIKNTDQAVARFQKVLKILPDDPDLHFKLGLHHFAAGNYPEMIAQFKKVLRLQPVKPRTHFYIALAYHIKNQGEQALEHMEQAKQIYLQRIEANTVFKKDGKILLMKEDTILTEARKHLDNFQQKYGGVNN